MKLFRRLTVRAMALAVICYPLMWVVSWAMGRKPLAPCIVAVVSAIAVVFVSDDLFDDNSDSQG